MIAQPRFPVVFFTVTFARTHALATPHSRGGSLCRVQETVNGGEELDPHPASVDRTRSPRQARTSRMPFTLPRVADREAEGLPSCYAGREQKEDPV